jgi:hypothetical protein
MSSSFRSRRPRLTGRQLQALTDEATVDAHDESDQQTGFLTMLDEHLAIPFTAEVLGNSVRVEGLDLDDTEDIVAITNINGETPALSARHRYWTPAKAALATLLLLTGLTRNAGAQSHPIFYFRDRNGIVSAPVQHEAPNPVDLDLVFETASVEERSRYPDLIIKDFRYGPTYFHQQTLNVPTVDFVVTAVDRGGHESATMFQVASQGGGVDVGMLHRDVWFRLGRFPFMHWFRDYMWLPVNSSARGTYHIRATYHPGPQHAPAQYSTSAIVVVK